MSIFPVSMDSVQQALMALQESVVQMRTALAALNMSEAAAAAASKSRPSSPIIQSEHDYWMKQEQALEHIQHHTRQWQDLSATYKDHVSRRVAKHDHILFAFYPSSLNNPFTAMIASSNREDRSRKLRIMSQICSVDCIWYSIARQGFLIWGSQSKYVRLARLTLDDMTQTPMVRHEPSSPVEEELSQDESPSPSVHNLDFADLV